jgi:hypothetical protein
LVSAPWLASEVKLIAAIWSCVAHGIA